MSYVLLMLQCPWQCVDWFEYLQPYTYSCTPFFLLLTIVSSAPQDVTTHATDKTSPYPQPPTPTAGMSLCCVDTYIFMYPCLHLLLGLYIHILWFCPLCLPTVFSSAPQETLANKFSPIPALGMSTHIKHYVCIHVHIHVWVISSYPTTLTIWSRKGWWAKDEKWEGVHVGEEVWQ